MASALLGTYPLLDRHTGLWVDASLWRPVEERHARDFDERWRPMFEARQEELKAVGQNSADNLHQLQDAHWDWSRKAKDAVRRMDRASFAVDAEGETQGLMIVQTTDLIGQARAPSQEGEHLVQIELLATAPWNRAAVVPKPRFKGVGTLLLAAAISLSIAEEFGGRIGLHALPQAESWYRDVCGMTDLDIDSTGMRYFEMTEAQARAFLAS